VIPATGCEAWQPTGRAPSNAFTVDLEEWFHVCGAGDALSPDQWDRLPARIQQTTRTLLDLLDHAQVRATFFVVGWIAERYPHLVEEVRLAGHEIGSHGHLHRRLFEMRPETLTEDLRASVVALRAAGAPGVRLFRAPEWSINDRSLWALDTLVQEGFTVDASMAPLKLVGSVAYPRYPHARITPAGSILEVPPFVADRLGQVIPMGWGWGLRMSAPARVLKAIDSANRVGMPAVVMVHPWELDPDPPRVRLPAGQRFAHYFCLSGFASRLREVLTTMEFGPISRLAAMVTAAA
jgi:polysaccharide deacetylase family protein (PEP-CTERM system associated)